VRCWPRRTSTVGSSSAVSPSPAERDAPRATETQRKKRGECPDSLSAQAGVVRREVDSVWSAPQGTIAGDTKAVVNHIGEKNMPSALITDLLGALDDLAGGVHAGFRPAHAKGCMCAGTFSPSPQAAVLTRAPHASRPTTPVTVRYSNGTGVPTIPDNDPAHSGPRGIAVRFHLANHVHTDIVAHSTNGFPVRTGEEFLEFLRAAAAAAAGKPEAIGAFLATHPSARRFVEVPKPVPTSFAREAFFAVTAFEFINSQGVSRHGRFRIRPEGGTEYLSDEKAATELADFLFEEIGPRLASGPIRLSVSVQLAADGDDVADASVPWPESREELPFGTVTLTECVDDTAAERRKIIFDPIPRVDGIDTSGDPLSEVRSEIYLHSGRRRRAAGGT
jgi:catalase